MAYDVVVVGGGTAGCALAARLSEDPTRSICLVEAGPDYGSYTDGRWPDDILDGRWLALDSHRWEQDDEDDRSQARARILGGCSAHNACVVLRGADTDYDEWGDGWTAAALRPYLDRAEGMLRTRVLEERELHPWQRAFAGAAGADTIVHPVNMTENGVRWTTAFAYIDPARDRPNLTILPDTLVGRVLLEGERAAGVNTFAGQLEAGMVVLAAGADPGYEISAAAFAMKPRSRGRVTLSSPDARVPLRIEHGFLRDEADVPVLVEGF